MVGENELQGKSNYFIGNDRSKWHRGVPLYAKVRYHDVYPGIDLAYYGNPDQLEHDFMVSPGANPSRIHFSVTGSENAHLNPDGSLSLATPSGEATLHRPVCYQVINGVRHPVEGRFVLCTKHGGVDGSTDGGRQSHPPLHTPTDPPTLSFRLASYDHSRPLVIDPTLSYSTYLGGSTSSSLDNEITGLALDSGNHLYVAGYTDSPSFPTTSGVVQRTLAGSWDAFITKLDLSQQGANCLVYSTFIGGLGLEVDWDTLGPHNALAIDSSGSAYLVGSTYSSDFPTVNAYQSTFTGDTAHGNIFVVRLSADASRLLYSTYLGGSTNGSVQEGDHSSDIALDSAGHIVIAGLTTNVNFPTTANALQTTNPRGDSNSTGIVAELDPSRSGKAQLLYSSYLGGGGTTDYADLILGLALDSHNNVYLTGVAGQTNFPVTSNAYQSQSTGAYPAFVTKMDFTQSGAASLLYSSFLGGSKDQNGKPSATAGFAIAVDSAGTVYITGETGAIDFPITLGAHQSIYAGGSSDAFVTRMDLSKVGANQLVYSTFLGGTGYEYGAGIAIDGAGRMFVDGETTSSDFPVTGDTYQAPINKGSKTSGFLSALDPSRIGSAQLIYSTSLHGSNSDIPQSLALSGVGQVAIAGYTTSSDFPLTPNAFQASLNGTQNDFISVFSYDFTAPTTRLTFSPPAGSNGEHPSPSTLTLTATDPDDSVAATYTILDGETKQTFSAPFQVSSGGSHTLKFWSVDSNGNVETRHSKSFLVDATVPTTSLSLAGTTGKNGWYVSSVSVTLSATDADGASDVAATYYQLDGGSMVKYSAPFTLNNGEHTLLYWSKDLAGNIESAHTAGLNVDATAPVTTCSLSGTAGSNGWWRSTVTVTLTASDNLSGVAVTHYTVDGGSTHTYTAPFTISTSAIHTLKFWSVDKAGNQETTRSRTIKIDKVRPAITETASPTSLVNDGSAQTVTVTGSMADTPSGVDTSTAAYKVTDEYATVHPSGTITLNADGTYSFTVSLVGSVKPTDTDGRTYKIWVSCKDLAGNPASTYVTVTVSP